MTINTFITRAAFWLACTVSVAPALAHCLIVGSPEAKVQTPEGVVTPLASSRQCESLRLLAGTATAMWTQSDGRPGAAAIRADRGPEGYPAGGNTASQDRFKQVLLALKTDGASVRAGFKRFDNNIEATDVYLDPDGIALPWVGSGLLALSVPQGRAHKVLISLSIDPGQRVVLPAKALALYPVVRAEFKQAGLTMAMVLRRLPDIEHAAATQALQGVSQLRSLSPQEQAVAKAMVFESLGLSFQRDMTLMP